MSIRQLPSARWTVPGTSGGIAANWYVYTYQPGTSTPKSTYTDYTGAVANANPLVLDARGEGNIWWDGTYKVMVYTGDPAAGGVLVWSQDNYGEGTSSVLQGNFNLVLNGSFEQDANGDGLPDNWTCVSYTGGTVALDATTQIHGAKSLKLTSIGTGGGYATSDYFEVQEARNVPVSFSTYSSAATVHVQVDIIWYTAAKAVVSTTTLHTNSATNPASWTAYSYTSTPPANARFAKIRLFGCKDDSAAAGSTWFDNVQAEALTELSAWFPNVNATVTATAQELNYSVGVTSAIQTQINTNTPPGIVQAYAGSSSPSGWLLCYGQAVSRTTYAALFAVISTTYGIGDGTTTFNVPDLRGRTLVGIDSMGGVGANRVTGVWADSLGGSAGEETHTLIEAEMPAHTHNVSGYGGSGGPNLSALSVGTLVGSWATSSAGTGTAHNNMQPSFALNYIIKS